MSRPTTPTADEAEATRATPGEPSDRPTTSAQPRLPFVAAGIVALLAAVLLVLLAEGGQSTAGTRPTGTVTVGAAPTATTTPTAQPTVTQAPMPTPMSGFKVYVDQQRGFLLQYPEGWMPSPLSNEVDFQDTAHEDVSFEMFVLLPDPGLLSTQGNDAQVAGAWVDHVLTTESQLHGEAFTRVPGPMPAAQFAGVEWQSGEGLLGVGTSQVRIQVFVTIHEGNPYVIEIAAADSAFDFATEDYFGSMLQSFAFLPSNG
jgi:hypothetical protein